MTDTNKMRERFESAWRASYPEHGEIALKRSGLDPEDYCNTRVKDAWWAWQASLAALVVELGAPSHWVADYAACGGGVTVFDAEKAAKVTDPMCSKTPSYTIHALEKAGLEVAP